jgi:hypothetical protein
VLRSLKCILLAACISVPGFAGAIITNGSGVYLGVDDYGQLNVENTAGLPGADFIGLYSTRTSGDSTSPGCLCEGWGIAANGSYQMGANNDWGGGFGNLISFSSTASTASSTVSNLAGNIVVNHTYQPSASSSLYEGIVTITNNTGATITDLRYRRVMDWDIDPTPFNEFVTIQGWPATALLATTNDGFRSPDPLSSRNELGGCADDANFTDCGPNDHGALFDFGFGDLAAGETKTFSIFYGWTATELQALAALGAVEAEVYSFGQAFDDADGDGIGDSDIGLAGMNRATFIFAFKGVGGTSVPAIPEPGTWALIAGGLAVMIGARKFRS